MEHVLDERAHELRRGAERVAVLAQDALVVLDLDVLLVLDGKPASLEERADVARDLDLTRVRARDVVDEGRERALVPDHGLDSERRQGLREKREVVRVVQREGRHRRRHSRAVDETERLLGAEHCVESRANFSIEGDLKRRAEEKCDAPTGSRPKSDMASRASMMRSRPSWTTCTLESGWPVMAAAMYDSGDKSPDAEMLPRRGTIGVMPWLRKLTSASRTERRTAE